MHCMPAPNQQGELVVNNQDLLDKCYSAHNSRKSEILEWTEKVVNKYTGSQGESGIPEMQATTVKT